MKTKSVYKTMCSVLCCCILASLTLVNEAKADGTEELGPPSIDIESGSYILAAGTGLKDAQPGNISIYIPEDVAIAQVLLYWTGRSTADPDDPDTIIVNNNMEVTGPRIGGPLHTYIYPSSTYRADITDYDLIKVGPNTLSVEGLGFDHSNDGAAVVVILQRNNEASNEIKIMDGNDFAYQPDDLQTVPVEVTFLPSMDDRKGVLWLIVSDIDVPRPAAVEITVNGVTTRLDKVLQDNEGDFLDVIELEVPIPANVHGTVTVQLLSIDDGSGLTPASLVWSFVSWEIPHPLQYEEPPGCTYTIGYWKNHPDDWPTDELSLYTGQEAMTLLWTSPKKGNAYIILAHQYIAAELNAVNGASVPDDVLDAWLDARELLEEYQDEETIPKKSMDRDLAIDLASMLDDYNNGLLGPGHCD